MGNSAKTAEIASGRKLKAELDEENAELQTKHAQSTTELENTRTQLGLDRTFLANLKKKCSESSDEFDVRVKDRMTEIAAVEDTIKILNEDTSFDNFGDTVNTASTAGISFVQVSAVASSAQKERLHRITSLLKQVAART